MKEKNNKKNHPLLYRRKKLTLGQRSADKMTEIFGSWFFIILFFVFLFTWMLINIIAWQESWDPYPFILLNLILSCLAAIQAPIIMMTQNRQNERDRLAAKYDHAVNRKAEREIQNMQKDLDEIKKLLKK
ncbi:MAG: DUF1003 domain-containing protein [Candidatus Magasanikbacteria bacterium]|nr:DUF1003 domain-containing protein [Candidatus Magasanikbacteria bacterium]